MNIPVSSNQYLAIGCKEHGCARKVLQELVDSQRAEIERLTKELRVVTAERDRAQRACEQIGQRLPDETSAWQSIETAPKDGRTVLVKSGNWVVTAHWHPSQCWATCGPSYEPIPSDEQPEKWAPIPEGGPSENGLGEP